MISNLWFYYALSSAILWGLAYTLVEKLLSYTFTTPFIMVAISLLQAALFGFFLTVTGGWEKNFAVIRELPLAFYILILGGLAFFVGNFLIFEAINLKNASYANLIEISYPLFTVLFSYLIFKNFEITVPAAIGGLLIFSGITLIYMKG